MELEQLGPELLCSVAGFLLPTALGRLASVSRGAAAALASPAAWQPALTAFRHAAGIITAEVPAPATAAGIHPREALRSLAALDRPHWAVLEPPGQAPAAAAAAAAAPSAREHHIAAITREGTLLVAFGCCVPRVHNDCWAFDLAARRWYEAATGQDEQPGHQKPGARYYPADGGGCGGGAVIADACGNQWLAVFGGAPLHIPSRTARADASIAPAHLVRRPGFVVMDTLVLGHLTLYLLTTGHRPEGYRDNETWLLGPLGDAVSAGQWRWIEVMPDGQQPAVADHRPSARFQCVDSPLRFLRLSQPSAFTAATAAAAALAHVATPALSLLHLIHLQQCSRCRGWGRGWGWGWCWCCCRCRCHGCRWCCCGGRYCRCCYCCCRLLLLACWRAGVLACLHA